MPSDEEIRNRIKYHRPNDEAINDIATMRTHALTWALAVADLLPEGREMSLALTHIETALFWANAGIAREEENWADDQTDSRGVG
jgi:hypothetical protein